jgi:riboflavin synthase
MFTGIVEEVGRIAAREQAGDDIRITVAANEVTRGTQVGDSISVSGCCLTATHVSADSFTVELTEETLRATAPRWEVETAVNLERAMPANGRFGGHVVAGHVEGVGTILAREDRDGATVLTVEAPDMLAPWLLPKGSITVDGVSLTVVDAGGPYGTQPDWPARRFSLWLIPHQINVFGQVISNYFRSQPLVFWR